MKILITGATGFVGSYLVRAAVDRGYETFAGVRSSSNLNQFKDIPSLTFVDLPYGNKSELKSYLLSCKEQYGKFDYIIHNAGITKCQKKSDFHKVNYENTKNFVEALIETNCIPQKFLYISSLGAIGPGDENTLEPLRGTDTPHPNTLYGLSKLKSEQLLQSTTGFPYIIARPTGVYGPEDKEYNIYVSMVDKGIEAYVGLKPQYMSFIYITDLVKALFPMLESKIEGKAYFISDGQNYTQQIYAGIIKKHLNRKTIKITFPLPIAKFLYYSFDIIGGWFGQVPTLNIDKYKIMSCRNWICDISELTRDFNFKPEYLLESGVKETVAWFQTNKKST